MNYLGRDSGRNRALVLWRADTRYRRSNDSNLIMLLHRALKSDTWIFHCNYMDIYNLLKGSPLFDRNYYLKWNPDVESSGVDPLRHFIEYGVYELRNPSALFDVSFYLLDNPDVRASGMNPLQHYILFGYAEGRPPYETALDARVLRPPFDREALKRGNSDSSADDGEWKEHKFVAFDSSVVEPGSPSGLHPSIKLIIPTRGCSKWLPFFLDAYKAWQISPIFAVDRGCEPATLDILKERNIELIFIDEAQLGNGESIMPYISKFVTEDYIFRLDDDEFPSADLMRWINSIPDSQYSFVTSWWLPRYEVAMLDGKLHSCHPLWHRTKVGTSLHENLHGGRFYRHREVIYDKVGAHHGNFISDYISHAPREALIIHLDYLVRTVEERINKIRAVEKRFKDAGWPFANHMIPEIAPRPLLYMRSFSHTELAPLINELLEKIYQPAGKATLTLTVDELKAIQEDRLTHDTVHFHY
jgi:hypothetical protein